MFRNMGHCRDCATSSAVPRDYNHTRVLVHAAKLYSGDGESGTVSIGRFSAMEGVVYGYKFTGVNIWPYYGLNTSWCVDYPSFEGY